MYDITFKATSLFCPVWLPDCDGWVQETATIKRLKKQKTLNAGRCINLKVISVIREVGNIGIFAANPVGRRQREAGFIFLF
ncbi:hypothetical protein TH63_04170 [Rufibacter radiotolerans]|uniref:Uncharacterized protein n=1 Tax=Rufibacter radiotolerans TaxID=1379910 RepID=A0A0H4VM82_9BACT|nr:hypothetical protein TH63_04170 [Rufibacter radiotolerans]